MLNDFMKKLELRIVYRSNVYLLNNLLQDWLLLYEDQEVSFQITYIWQFKKTHCRHDWVLQDRKACGSLLYERESLPVFN